MGNLFCYFKSYIHTAIYDIITAIDAAIDIDNSFGYFMRFSHAAIDIITAINAAIDIENSINYFKRYSHAALDDKNTAIDAAIDNDNSFGYFKIYSHAAIDDIMTAIDAAIDEDPLQPSSWQQVINVVTRSMVSSFPTQLVLHERMTLLSRALILPDTLIF